MFSTMRIFLTAFLEHPIKNTSNDGVMALVMNCLNRIWTDVIGRQVLPSSSKPERLSRKMTLNHDSILHEQERQQKKNV